MTEADGRRKRRVSPRGAIRAGVVLVWLAMLGWLLRYEAFPDYFTNTVDGYRSLFSRDVLVMDEWMRIEFNGTPIGFSHSSMELDEDNPEARHLVRNRVNVRMNVMGSEQKIYVDTAIRLDDTYDLQVFSFNLSSQGYKMHLEADRVEGQTFRVETDTGVSTQTRTITIPDDVVLYSPMTEMAMKRLKPGQSLTLRTLDPTTLSKTTLTIEALRTEPLTIGDETYEATVLATEYHGARVLSWVDRNGKMLRQETPFGWTMETCSMTAAFEALAGSAKQSDVLADMAVPCRGEVTAEQRTPLRLRLSGVDFREDELVSPRQQVERRNKQEVILTVAAGDAVGARGAAEVPGDMRPYLASTMSLQGDHPEILARARAITAGLDAPAEKAEAIGAWVHDNVEKVMTVSLPSAVDVLRTLKGDCNEHTYLYVALARAAGLPAKIVVGLAYHKGGFYYHAWPAVAVAGHWYETDPTWGQEAVDATHIAVLKGDLAKQLELIRIIGKLRIEVLD